jgi:putative hemolysin/membrane-bound inhibitor of C-type lysozyme
VKKNILIAIVGLLILFAGIFMYQSSPLEKEAGGTTGETVPAPVALANPASTFCVENGGTLEMKETPKGQQGICSFLNGASCEEWALFRGDCNVEGVSTTGHYSDGKSEVQLVFRMKTNSAILMAPTLGYDTLPLSQAMSGSGARYLSADGKVEFWEHQGEGRLSVDGKEIFLGKLTEAKQ